MLVAHGNALSMIALPRAVLVCKPPLPALTADPDESNTFGIWVKSGIAGLVGMLLNVSSESRT
jgi:hypothetical protein